MAVKTTAEGDCEEIRPPRPLAGGRLRESKERDTQDPSERRPGKRPLERSAQTRAEMRPLDERRTTAR
jgi:hypothetical protein